MSTIPALLEEAQGRYGDRLALAMRQGYRTSRWTYARLWADSGRIAARLQQEGVRKGDRIVFWAHNSPQWVAAFFGCMRTGAVAVPLDVRSTPEFACKVAESTQSRLAFVSSATRADAPALRIPLFPLESLEPFIAGSPPLPSPAPVSEHDIAEVIFTSGTTGTPKGVILTHANITSNVRAAAQVVPVEPGYRLLSLLPLSHMLEQTVGTLAPLSGGAAVFYPSSRQPNVIFTALNEYRITSLVLVPQALQLFLNAIEEKVRKQGKERLWGTLLSVAPRLPIGARRLLFRAVHKQLGGRLSFVMCGGAYLDPVLARTWEALGVRVLQGYGTTEASPIISCNSFRHSRLDSLGRPLSGVEVRIAEDSEVLVRGPNLTPGYWQDAKATQAAFTGGWYHTGDLGAMDRDGFLYFKGRKKDMIALPNGMKVYPEDIEARLHRHPGVSDAAVVGLPRDGQGVEVHAVLLLKGKAADPKAIITAVNQELADHQRIQGFTVWPDEDFPRTHTLKVKKHEVLQRLAQMQSSETAARSPAPVVSHIPALFMLAMQVARKPAGEAGPSSRLGSDLALDSLGRVELLAAVESELGVYLDESLVSGDTTLGELEAIVAQAGRQAKPQQYANWPLHPLVRPLRAAAQALFVAPLLSWCAPRRVLGREHLKALRGPVLFASNHLSHADTPLILASLPRRLRSRIAVAAAADHWFEDGRIGGRVAAFLFNAFPFSRTDSIRPSLERCSKLIERGWSVLIYPEGTRSNDGRMGSFKSGAGLMAVELGVPVVPVNVEGTNAVLPKDIARPRRGHVTVRFGKPLTFSSDASYLEAAQAVEAAVRGLAMPGTPAALASRPTAAGHS
ncbi:MAG: AMP-binding protein [Chloroflexi bacterium]|nr:AMP-binding protein [Chloroflexota bacterium]